MISILCATRQLVAAAFLLGAFEALAAGDFDRIRGILSWRVLEAQQPRARTTQRCFRILFDSSGTRSLLLVASLFSFGLLVPSLSSSVYDVTTAIVFATALLLNLRTTYGNEGSDQMILIVLAGLLATSVLRHTAWRLGGLVFIALQSALSYFVAGVAKLASPCWRSGEALARIANSRTFSFQEVALLARHRPHVFSFFGWATILFEVTFPLVLVLPMRFALAYLVMGALFHVFIAIGMGLNRFLWAFLSTYPSIIAVNATIHRSPLAA
jgi:hypothetical protein